MTGVWNDTMLIAACQNADAPLVYPSEWANVNPASIDLRLSPAWIDLRRNVLHKTDTITLEPGDAILASTLEYVRIPTNAAAMVLLKSSMARIGLDHALAGWVDPGFCGNLTLEFHAHRPLTLKAGQRVVQMVLWSMVAEPLRAYGVTGRYQGQTGPTIAREAK